LQSSYKTENNIFSGFCFESGINMIGNDIKILPFVTDVRTCQIECKISPACKFFAYSEVNTTCWLKNATSKRVVAPSFVIGQRDCSGNSLGSL
jgi:hypothetical protein